MPSPRQPPFRSFQPAEQWGVEVAERIGAGPAGGIRGRAGTGSNRCAHPQVQSMPLTGRTYGAGLPSRALHCADPLSGSCRRAGRRTVRRTGPQSGPVQEHPGPDGPADPQRGSDNNGNWLGAAGRSPDRSRAGTGSVSRGQDTAREGLVEDERGVCRGREGQVLYSKRCGRTRREAGRGPERAAGGCVSRAGAAGARLRGQGVASSGQGSRGCVRGLRVTVTYRDNEPRNRTGDGQPNRETNRRYAPKPNRSRGKRAQRVQPKADCFSL